MRVQSVLESKEHTQSGRKGQHNSKQTEGRNRPAAEEHGVAATVRLYAMIVR